MANVELHIFFVIVIGTFYWVFFIGVGLFVDIGLRMAVNLKLKVP